MKKIIICFLCLITLGSCSKHDPILPGVRHDIFESDDVVVLNKEIGDLSNETKNIYGTKDCGYRQDSSNIVWRGDKKIFTGFSTNTSVLTNQSPVCDGDFIYTGLSTGEVIKVNTKNNKVIWVSDIFKSSNLTGGASVVDIVAHVGVDGGNVYAGGLGDAFCKLNAKNGNKIWCLNISVPVDFIMVDNFIFVVGTDNNLYAIDSKDGSVYWATKIKKQIKPIYDGKFITVGKQRINFKTGEIKKIKIW